MIRLIIVRASYQFTYMRKFNGLRLEECCDAPHFIFHFEMRIMNDVESCHVITANQPSSCKNSKCGPRLTIHPDFLVPFRNFHHDVQHHHSEQWIEWLLQRLLLSINYKRHHQCTRVWNLWQRDEVGRRIKFAIHVRFNNLSFSFLFSLASLVVTCTPRFTFNLRHVELSKTGENWKSSGGGEKDGGALSSRVAAH